MGMCDDFFKGALKVIRPLLLVEKPDIIKAARRWELPVWSNPCPSAGKTNRANFQAKIDALHGGDKMLKTNLFNGLCRWQLAQVRKREQGMIGKLRKAIERRLSVQDVLSYSAITLQRHWSKDWGTLALRLKALLFGVRSGQALRRVVR